jgi:hypothetical protein
VQVTSENGRHSFASRADVEAVVSALNSFSGFSLADNASGQHPQRPRDVSPEAYAVLLASADVWQSARVRSRMERKMEWIPVMTTELLESEWRSGCTSDDVRWAVSAAVWSGPDSLRKAGEGMARGIQELERSGVMRPGGRGYQFTETGQALAHAFGEIQACAAGIIREADGPSVADTAVAHLSLFNCRGGTFAVQWTGANPTLREVDAAMGGDAIREFIEAPAVRPKPVREATENCTNPACGKPLRPGVKFCPACAQLVVRTERCSNCKAELRPGKRFCTSCGTPRPT